MMDGEVERVKKFLADMGYEGNIHHTEDTIFTVDDASRAVGAPPAEILKSLIFLVSGRPVLILMSGVNKVDGKKVAVVTETPKSKVKMASPDFVFEKFGYRVGGVPPVGYDPSLPALIDEDLLNFDIVWAAAGTDHDFFPIRPETLLEYTGGSFVDVRVD